MAKGKLVLTERQTRVLIRAAEKERAIVEVDMHGVTVRLIPPSRQNLRSSEIDGEEYLVSGLKSWDEPPLKTSTSRASDTVPAGGRKVVADGCLWDWKEFKVHVQSRPPNKRERDGLTWMSAFEVDVPIPYASVKISPSAQERLEARGFIRLVHRTNEPDRIECIVPTATGLAAATKLEE